MSEGRRYGNQSSYKTTRGKEKGPDGGRGPIMWHITVDINVFLGPVHMCPFSFETQLFLVDWRKRNSIRSNPLRAIL